MVGKTKIKYKVIKIYLSHIRLKGMKITGNKDNIIIEPRNEGPSDFIQKNVPFLSKVLKFEMYVLFNSIIQINIGNIINININIGA